MNEIPLNSGTKGTVVPCPTFVGAKTARFNFFGAKNSKLLHDDKWRCRPPKNDRADGEKIKMKILEVDFGNAVGTGNSSFQSLDLFNDGGGPFKIILNCRCWHI